MHTVGNRIAWKIINRYCIGAGHGLLVILHINLYNIISHIRNSAQTINGPRHDANS